ncbi:hypothetical protein CDL12_00588 [Handroanthus impetiginosus]|uniref:Apoptotic ATPase n=1 Tax=Handroanthus impetiginosus TaxID=429701 RepID=A0A2G9IA73_9LAMI|nr:hypothetical protein CDL12_00588 [Handroanthus impetiginosus]
MEKLVEYAFDTFLDKKNLESTLEAMKNSLNSLSDKAFDVEDKIRNAELSGKKKRKREVEQWLKQVNIIESEFRTLESEVQTQGFLRKFFNGDQLTQLNAKIHELVEQSQHFREVIIDVYEMRGEALLTTNLCGKGFKENLKRIWNLLKSDNVSSIGICGMGGVGKTALVRHINSMILGKRKEKRVCWITISQVFGIKKLQEEIAHSIEIEELAKSMVKICDGLPLGIIVLAGSMRGETSVHVWRNELEKLRDPNMVRDDQEHEVFKVLNYSFARLDLNHQVYFLHCSLYPEDSSIHKWELVERFISEELVDIGKSRQSQLDQGFSTLNKLVKACLLESVHEYWVKMHDLVRAMALKITKGKNMVISGLYSLKEIPNEGAWTKDLEKVSLMCNGIMEIPDGMLLDCPNLTTLILHQNPLHFISDSFFSQLDNLCFVDLSYTKIEKLPNSLSNLENLKALNLRFCWRLVEIPDLGKLKKLRELDLSSTAIKKVPQGMEELVNLRFLSLIDAEFLDILPEGLFLNLRLLQCLHLPFKIKAPIDEIMNLKYLEEFEGRVKNVSDFSKYIRRRQSQLTIFGILVCEGVTECYGDRHKVIVRQCDLKNEGEEASGILVHNIYFLMLEKCEGLSNSLLDDFPRLNKPSSLKVLEISKCRAIECFLTNEQFLMANQEIESSTLFFSLRSLCISECNKMRKLGLPLSAFQNLEEISIHNCDEIKDIIEVQQEEGRAVSLLKLKVLSPCHLPRLKSICNTKISCGSINTIQLFRCRELKKLPLYFGPTSHSPPQTLERITAWEGDKEWWESLEWEYPSLSHLLQPLVEYPTVYNIY